MKKIFLVLTIFIGTYVTTLAQTCDFTENSIVTNTLCNMATDLQTSNQTLIARDKITFTNGFHLIGTEHTFTAKIDHSVAKQDVDYLTGSNIIDGNSRTLDKSNNIPGSISGTIDVSPSGAASYSIPISVSPGSHGMQPRLSIVYNSNSGNDILGYGWHLAGLSAITRSTKSQYYDGVNSGISFSASDALRLNGVRLISTGSNIYSPENDPYTKIQYDGTSFTITSQDGTIMEYGNTNDSRFVMEGNASPISWAINKVTDPNGNYIQYKYAGDNTLGNYRISEIDYTGNSNAGRSPYNKILFYYDLRSDVNTVYVSGASATQNVLLTGIKVFCEDALSKDYEFSYFNDGLYSKLNKISHNADGISYNPTIVDWGDTPGCSSTVTDVGADLGSLNANKLYFGDFDGDGETEVITDCSTLVPAYEETIDGDVVISQHFTFKDATVTDWNNDGKDELAVHYLETIVTESFDPESITEEEFDNVDYYNLVDGVYTLIDSKRVNISSGTHYKRYYADLDADGFVEKLTIKLNGTATNGSITRCSNINGSDLNISISNVNDIKFLDFDGDGQLEILALTDEGYGSIWKYNGSTFINIYGDGTSAYSFGKTTTMKTGDFNGDGKTDYLIYSANGSWYIYYSTGKGFVSQRMTFDMPIPELGGKVRCGYFNGDEYYCYYWPASDVLVSDLNNDGKSDIILAKYNSCFAYISKGHGFSELHLVHFPYTWIVNVQLHAVDLDGDGQTEIIYGSDDLPFEFTSEGAVDFKPDQAVHYNYQKISFNNRLNQGLYVNSITDGNNNTSTINYSTFNDNTTAQKTWPIRVLRGPMQVVSNVSTTNGSKTWSNLNYTYENGAFAFGVGFLGFGTSTTTNTINGLSVISNFVTSNYTATVPNSSGIYHTWLASQTTKKNGNDISLLENTTMSFKGGNLTKKLFLPLITSSKTTDKLKNIYVINDIVSFNASTGQSENVKSTSSDNQVTQTVSTYDQVLSISSNVYRTSEVITTRTKTGSNHTSTNTFTYGNTLFPLRRTSQTSQGKITINNTGFDAYGNITNTTVHVNDAYATPDRSTSRTYDTYGRFVMSSIDVEGLTSSFLYRACDGALLSKTDPNGLVSKISYSTGASSFVTGTTLPDGNLVNNTLAWDGTGASLYYNEKTLSNGATNTEWFNAGGQKVKETNNSGLNGALFTTTYTYNTDGTLNTVTTPGNVITTYLYKTDGRPDSEINNIGTQSLIYSYPTGQNKVTITDNISGQTKTQTFDDLGNVTQITGTTGQIDYTYFASGKLKQVVTGGSTSSMTYDPLTLDQLTLTDPNSGTSTYTYNGFGQLKTQTDAKGQQTICEYDGSGRLTSKTAPGINESYTYLDTPGYLGLLGSVTRNNVSETYTYDELNRAKTITITGPATPGASSSDFITTYTYYSNGQNGAGQVASIAYPTGLTVNNTHDVVGNLIQINNANGGSKIWSGDEQNPLGQWTQYSLGNNLVSKWSYDDKFLLESIKTGTSANETSVQNLGFTFNNFGQLTNRTDGSLSETFTYTDGKDRLTSAQLGSGTLHSFTYQPNGNIDNTTLAGKYNYSLTAHPHAVSSSDGATGSTGQSPSFTTTSNFNSQNMVLDIENSLYKDEFVYGTDGNRFRVDFNTSGSRTLSKVYIGNCEFGYNASNTQIYKRTIIYAPTGVCAVYEDNCAGSKEISYIHTDYQGSWLAITNSTGSLTNKYSYDAWGRPRNPATWELLPINITDALVNLNAMQPRFDRGYTGHEIMAGFGLINMNGRLYDPYLQRFLSPDIHVQDPSNSQSYNKYSYVLNNPLRYTDPSGYSWLSDFGDWIKSGFDNLGDWLTKNDINFQVGYSTSTGGFFSGTPYFGTSYNGSQYVNVGYNTGTGNVVSGINNGGFTNFSNPSSISPTQLVNQQVSNSISNLQSQQNYVSSYLALKPPWWEICGEVSIDAIELVDALSPEEKMILSMHKARLDFINHPVTQGTVEAMVFVVTGGVEGVFSLVSAARSGIARLSASTAAKMSTTAFKSFTKSNYRFNLQVLTGKSGVGMDAHHIFPQAERFHRHWNRVGLNIHNPKNMSWWSSSAHKSAASRYNKAWDGFFKQFPYANQQQIRTFGTDLMKTY